MEISHVIIGGVKHEAKGMIPAAGGEVGADEARGWTGHSHGFTGCQTAMFVGPVVVEVHVNAVQSSVALAQVSKSDLKHLQTYMVESATWRLRSACRYHCR